MNHSAKITSKGQITIPADLRKTLGLSPGDRVDFVQNAAGKYELRARKGTLADLYGIFRLEKPISSQELESWIEEARAALGSRALNDRD